MNIPVFDGSTIPPEFWEARESGTTGGTTGNKEDPEGDKELGEDVEQSAKEVGDAPVFKF